MTKISKNYFDKFDDYNNSLRQYKVSLQDKNKLSAYYNDLVSKYNTLEAEFTTFKSLMTKNERNTLIEVHGRLLEAQKALVIDRNNTRSEGDLIPVAQLQQEGKIAMQIEGLHSQVRALFKSIGEEDTTRNDGVIPVYDHQLTPNELATDVLDAHAFYRMITKKRAAGEYNDEQFDNLFIGISENLTKAPMTVAGIITFYQNHQIPPLSDNELRALSTHASQTRGNKDNDYIKETMTVSYKTALESLSMTDSRNTPVIKDADSFYKLIFNKFIREEYKAKEFYDLYINTSEKLVHSVLTKDEINRVYHELGIKPLKENEWDALIARQENRRQTDNIAQKSGNLDFQGTVLINAGQNFTLNVDLYFNEQAGTADFNIQTMPGVLLETSRLFNDIFGIRKLGDATHFRIFIFNNRQDYIDYTAAGNLAGHASPSDNGNVASIYMFQGKDNYEDPDSLLCHEFVHALTFQATAKLSLPRTFMEGMAQYIMFKMEGKSTADIVQMIPEESTNRSIKDIILTPLSENDHYTIGPAIVAWLQETAPDFFRELLFTAEQARKNDSHFYLYKMMNDFFAQQANKTLKEMTWFLDRMSDAQKNYLPNPDETVQHHHQPQTHSAFLGMQGNDSGNKVHQHADPAQNPIPQSSNNDRTIVDYLDIQNLYNTVKEEEKSSVRMLWDKLHAVRYSLIEVALNEEERRYIERLYKRDYDDDFDEEPETVYVNMGIDEGADAGQPPEVVYTASDFFG